MSDEELFQMQLRMNDGNGVYWSVTTFVSKDDAILAAGKLHIKENRDTRVISNKRGHVKTFNKYYRQKGVI